MNKQSIAKASIEIKASPARVWQALTDPDEIKKYWFGTTAKSDWKVGSPITFTGVWEGKEYEDKGVIVKNEQQKVLQYTYWSNFTGKADTPENYDTVTFELESDGKVTNLAISQTSDEAGRKKSEENWQQLLESIKSALEK